MSVFLEENIFLGVNLVAKKELLKHGEKQETVSLA